MLSQIRKVFSEISGLPALVKQSSLELKKITSLAGTAMFSAIGVLINQFTIQFGPTLRLGFFFLPVAVSAMLYGPLLTGLVGIVTDLLKYFTTSGGSPFFIGYTIGEFIRGFLFGLVLYKKPVTIARTSAAKILDTLVNNLILGPLWLSILYGKAFIPMISMRLVKNIIMLPIEILLLYILCKRLSVLAQKFERR